jgi:hypothetical protein
VRQSLDYFRSRLTSATPRACSRLIAGKRQCGSTHCHFYSHSAHSVLKNLADGMPMLLNSQLSVNACQLILPILHQTSCKKLFAVAENYENANSTLFLL